MIKPINITPLNTTQILEYKCEKCGDFGTMTLTNEIIDVDRNGNPERQLNDYECPECGAIL